MRTDSSNGSKYSSSRHGGCAGAGAFAIRSFALSRLRVIAYRDGVGTALRVAGHFDFRPFGFAESFAGSVCSACLPST